MQLIQYIMVTKWDGHWDNFHSPIPNAQSTLFRHSAIKANTLNIGPWPTKAKTLFIKLNYNNRFEKAWIGYSENFRQDFYKGDPAIRFEVTGLQEIDCPEVYKRYNIGWYLNNTANPVTISSVNENLLPSFFKGMSTCNASDFELYCYYLLRLLGIHTIHKIPQDNNRGKADGFFKLQNLAVIYDATLETNYLSKKETQIRNYIGQLQKDSFEHSTYSYTIRDAQRQVWIITRGDNVKLIRNVDESINVKEIPYTMLIDVYKKRLEQEIGQNELWDILKDLK